MINLRSPYFVIYQVAAETTLTQVDIEIYIHTGTQSATTTGAQYTLSGTAITPPTGAPYVVFDISELARDYVDNEFDGTYAGEAVWINYELTTYIAGVAQTPKDEVQLTGFDGYHYFEDGVQSATHNHTSNPPTEVYTAPDVLQSNTIIYKSDDGVVRLPVLQDNNPTITFMYKGEVTNTETITSTTTAADIIRYVTNGGATYDTFKARVEADSGTLEDDALGDVFARYGTQLVDRIVVTAGSNSYYFTIKNVPNCRYEHYKVTFVNKFGAYQDMWFFGRSDVSISTQKDEYMRNTVSIGTYSINKHSNTILTKNGRESIKLNTDWYPEEYNEVFRQLLLSEEVWITYDNDVLPINITTSGMDFKKSVNEKLSQYTIQAEFAFDKISNIR